MKEMRLLIHELLPTQLDEVGLVNTIQLRLDTVEKRAGINARLLAGELGYLQDSETRVLYRIAREALNNSLKHANANEVTVCIHRPNQDVHLEIADDGIGFEPQEAASSGGLGLQSMQQRAQRSGGEFSIDSAPQKGTRIKVVLRCSND